MNSNILQNTLKSKTEATVFAKCNCNLEEEGAITLEKFITWS